MQRYVPRARPPLSEHAPRSGSIDDCWDGFTWLNVDDAERSSVAFMRTVRSGSYIVCALNFTPVRYDDFTIGLPKPRRAAASCINSDDARYGGSGVHNAPEIASRGRALPGAPLLRAR